MRGMVSLPPVAPTVGWRASTRLARDHYVRIDSNHYSVHPAVIGRRIEILVSPSRPEPPWVVNPRPTDYECVQGHSWAMHVRGWQRWLGAFSLVGGSSDLHRHRPPSCSKRPATAPTVLWMCYGVAHRMRESRCAKHPADKPPTIASGLQRTSPFGTLTLVVPGTWQARMRPFGDVEARPPPDGGQDPERRNIAATDGGCPQQTPGGVTTPALWHPIT